LGLGLEQELGSWSGLRLRIDLELGLSSGYGFRLGSVLDERLGIGIGIRLRVRVRARLLTFASFHADFGACVLSLSRAIGLRAKGWA
jgi:hypothetical protein